MDFNGNKAFTEDAKIDLVDMLRKLVRKWHWFAITVPVFLVLGYLSVKRSHKIYTVGAQMLINEMPEFNNLGESQYNRGGIQLMRRYENIENEIGVLTSAEIVGAAVEKIDWQVSYYKEETFKADDLFLGVIRSNDKGGTPI
ncbi:MAG: Wzz/FepE/Etk N-terminal domain-containing protein [Bacteroidota bacterium]